MGDYDTAPSNVPADMDYLKPKYKTVDFLFLDAFVADYYVQMLKSLKPGAVFPMHYAGQEEKYPEFAAALKKAGIDIPVYCPAKPGDRFEYRNGTITR
jgi:L-ascorbate metabolism protein UlaG (beta-lactamase superfamily)